MNGSQFLTVPTVPFSGSFIMCFNFEYWGIIKRDVTTSTIIQREFPISETELKDSVVSPQSCHCQSWTMHGNKVVQDLPRKDSIGS